MNNHRMTPRMAVLAANTLTGLGLRSILEKIMPVAEVSVFQSLEALEAAGADDFVHYFIDMQAFVEHSGFFEPRRRRTILLASVPQLPRHAEGMHCINVCAGEEGIVRDILRLHRNAHAAGPHGRTDAGDDSPQLTPREREVLVLVARGMMNKQIADRLGIGLTTVISHRRNIIRKLGIRSVSGLTMYAVMRGYVDADTI